MITGLMYIPDFISAEEELGLISAIDSSSWLLDLKRRTQHYGYKYDYTKKTIDSSMNLGPLPEWLHSLTARLVEMAIFSHPIDQVIINEYLPGQGISKHTDCVPCFGDTIASLSLGSMCCMVLEHIDSSKKGTIMLGPRSLLVLADEARYQWMHSIPARTTDIIDGLPIMRSRRLSLTFRTIKK